MKLVQSGGKGEKTFLLATALESGNFSQYLKKIKNELLVIVPL